jgi:hypothetical protein
MNPSTTKTRKIKLIQNVLLRVIYRDYKNAQKAKIKVREADTRLWERFQLNGRSRWTENLHSVCAFLHSDGRGSKLPSGSAVRAMDKVSNLEAADIARSWRVAALHEEGVTSSRPLALPADASWFNTPTGSARKKKNARLTDLAVQCVANRSPPHRENMRPPLLPSLAVQERNVDSKKSTKSTPFRARCARRCCTAGANSRRKQDLFTCPECKPS